MNKAILVCLVAVTFYTTLIFSALHEPLLLQQGVTIQDVTGTVSKITFYLRKPRPYMCGLFPIKRLIDYTQLVKGDKMLSGFVNIPPLYSCSMISVEYTYHAPVKNVFVQIPQRRVYRFASPLSYPANLVISYPKDRSCKNSKEIAFHIHTPGSSIKKNSV